MCVEHSIQDFLFVSRSSIDLMGLLVASQDLFVIQTEFSLYVMLKFWVFLKLHPAWDGSAQEGITSAHSFFQTRAGTPPNWHFLLQSLI